MPEEILPKPFTQPKDGQTDLPLPEKEIPAHVGGGHPKSKIILAGFFAALILAAVIEFYLFFIMKDANNRPVPIPAPVALNTPTPNPTGDWKTYTFPSTTVTFKYPADWTLKENFQYSPKSITLSKQDTSDSGMYRIILEVGTILGGAGSASPFQRVNQFTINGQPAYILSNADSSQPSIYTLSSCDAPKKCLFTASGSKIDFYADHYIPGSQASEPIPADDPRTDIALKILSTFKFTDASTLSPTGNQTACTEDAKLCSDGVTSVGRSGPTCEFDLCPQ